MNLFRRIDNDDLDIDAFIYLQKIGFLETCWILDIRWCMQNHLTYEELVYGGISIW